MADLDMLPGAIGNLISEIERATAAGLKAWGDGVLAESQQRVPVDTGQLRDSGFMEGPFLGSNEVAISLGFDTPYATRIHEDVGMAHPRGGQAKFLESVITERLGELPGTIASEIRAVPR